MGLAKPRRAAPLRDADAGGCPGGTGLDHHSAEARGYRRAFLGFDPAAIARFDAARVADLLLDPGIVRNRLKVESTVSNARAVLALYDRGETLSDLLWGLADGAPHQNAWVSLSQVPARTAESDRMSRELRRRGFRFVGSTICYSLMQAVGMVNDHTLDCFRYRALVER